MKRAIAMGAAMFCVTAPSVLQGQGTKSVAPSTSTYEQRRMEMSLFRGTNALRQLAKLHGGSYTYEEPAQRGWLQYHIADLTQESQTIVIGAPGLSKAVLSSDGNRVETEYQVRVEKTLKGSVRPGDIFTVRLPGGKYAFNDGSAAELQTPEFQRILIRNRYLLCSRL